MKGRLKTHQISDLAKLQAITVLRLYKIFVACVFNKLM